MEEPIEKIQKRMTELSARAAERGCYTFTEFLTAAEQDALCRIERRLPAPATLSGGIPGAERKLARFGSPEELGWEEPFPIACVCVSPASEKFADRLSHRDFLGSLMAQGVRREVLGDIAVLDNRGYVICLQSMADYLCGQLTQVRHTTVRCAVCPPPQTLLTPPEQSALVVASQRLDAVVAAVWRLSRSESQSLFQKGLVFVDSRQTENVGAQLSEGSVVSVRGLGRFQYDGIEKETKKGRLRVLIRRY